MRWVWSESILNQLSDIRSLLPTDRTISVNHIQDLIPGEFKIFVLTGNEIDLHIKTIGHTDWLLQVTNGTLPSMHERADFLMTVSKLRAFIQRGDLFSLGAHVLFEKPFHDLIHDIRTPLSVIYTGLELLIMKKAEEKPEVILEKIHTSKAHLERIKMMTSNFVDMIRSKEVPFFIKEENPVALAEQVVKNQASRLKMEHKSIVLDLVPMKFEMDRNIFKQMIFNLVEHGIYFSSQASMTLRVKREGVFLLGSLSYQGSGKLSDSQRQLIFETESRIRDEIIGINYNKGFGLTYNRKMARLQGGDAGLECVEGKGVFEYTLWFKMGASG